MNIDKIGNYIKELRCSNNLTQEELASKIFVTNKAVSRWESGKNLPGIDTLYLLSKELNVSVNDILNAGCTEKEKIKKYYDKIKFKTNLIEIILFLILILIPFFIAKINASYISAGIKLFEMGSLDINGLNNYLNLLIGNSDFGLLFMLAIVFLIFIFIKLNKKWLLTIPFILSLIFSINTLDSLFNINFNHIFKNNINVFICIFFILTMIISIISFLFLKMQEEK